MKREPWPCTLTGRTHGPDGRVVRMERRFDGFGDLEGAAKREMAKRRDRGVPFYGEEVLILTPLHSTRHVIDPDTLEWTCVS